MFQRLADFILDAVQIEDRPLTRIVLDTRFQLRHKFTGKFLDALIGLARVDANLFQVGVPQIAHGAHGQRQVLVHQGMRGFAFYLLPNRQPQLLQEVHIAQQILFTGTFGHGPHDITAGGKLRRKTGQDFLEPLPFTGILDLL